MVPLRRETKIRQTHQVCVWGPEVRAKSKRRAEDSVSKQSPSRCGTPTIDPVRRTDLLGLCELFLEDKFPPLLLAFPSPSTRQTGNPHVFGGRYFNSLVVILRHKCFFIVSAFLPDQLPVTLSSSPAWNGGYETNDKFYS